MSLVRVLREADYRQMPWKNGGGITTEIAVFPHDANTTNFDWRISMAQIAVDGWFSKFLGVDRTLSILAGKGIMLSVAGTAETQISPASAPYSFPADTPAYARLIDDPVADLNVMTRRGSFSHRVFQLESSAFSEWNLNADTTIVLCHTSPLQIKTEKALVQLAPLDAVIFDSVPETISLSSGNQQKIHLIEINCHSRYNQVRT